MIMEESTRGIARGSRHSSYGFNGKLMLISVVVLFAVCIIILCFHSYARWVIHRRLRSLGRRNRRPRRASVHSFYSDATATATATAAATASPQGLHSSVLKSLPIFLYASASASAAHNPPLDCAVCLSEFQDYETARLLPKCNHCFHLHCIDMWFHSHSNCPLCRAPVQQILPVQTREPAGPDSGSGCQISSSRWASDEREPPELERMAVLVEVPIPMRSNASTVEMNMMSEDDGRLKGPGGRVGSLKRFFSI